MLETNILQAQIEYYRQRAAEYDEWFFRQGRYDRGAAHLQQWFVDSLFDRTPPAINHAELHQQGYAERKLNDGRIYQVVKIFHEPIQLEKSLQKLGWTGNIHTTTNHFIYGSIHLG